MEIRDADRVVAEVAAANGGQYSVDLHLRHDPSATQAFAETHVRRLEAMRRAGVGVEREADGAWTIAEEHVDSSAAYEARRPPAQPGQVDNIAARTLGQPRAARDAPWAGRDGGAHA